VKELIKNEKNYSQMPNSLTLHGTEPVKSDKGTNKEKKEIP
jgi:hypothetical protein